MWKTPPHVGPGNPRWKGGVCYHRYGKIVYRYLYLPGNPMEVSGHYVAEHRIVAAQKIGRSLRSDDIVHHINGDTLDNRPENLEVTTRAAHASIHQPENLEKRLKAKFRECGGER